jgi:hypothetical protein
METEIHQIVKSDLTAPSASPAKSE